MLLSSQGTPDVIRANSFRIRTIAGVSGLALAALLASAAVALPNLPSGLIPKFTPHRAGVPADTVAEAPSLVPQPAQMQRRDEVFTVRSGTVVLVPPGDAKARWTADWLADLLARTRGVRLEVREGGEAPADAIRFVRPRDPNASGEAYDLDVGAHAIVVTAPTDAGLFYGATTLWQLLSQREGKVSSIAVGGLRIHDQPRFQWRGLLLDSARHFQSPAFVEAMIDAMAQRKLNVLHWHLNDDQGWRLEIRKYPRLTEVGAWRVPAGQGPLADIDPATGQPRLYGGFYTQDQVREIVRYAQARNVTIVPEIEMPGHASAVLAAYPDLASTPNPPRAVPGDWGVYPNLYSTDDKTIAFLQDVLVEVMDLFPGRYIHVGGDEAVKDQWKASAVEQAKIKALGLKDEEQLQSWFTGRIDAFLTAHGRRLVGWDDILKGGLTPNATVMSWQGAAGAVAAAKQGHDTVLAVDPTLYFDHRQNDAPDQPPGRGSVLSLKDVHGFDPAPASLSADERRRVLGLEGAMWSEHIRTEDRMAFMTFPRADAIAELGWSPAGASDWSGFLARMPAESGRLRMTGLAASDSAFEPRFETALDGEAATVALSSQAGLGEIRYTLNGAEPSSSSPRYDKPLSLKLPARVTAATFQGDRRLSHTVERRLDGLTLRRRDSHELKTCAGKLELSLEDDAPVRGPRAVFLVDILQPCWIYPQADLTGISAISAEVGQLPFNFQIGRDVDKIHFRAPATPQGELEVRIDGCDGERIAVLPLALAAANPAVTALPPAPIAARLGKHDLCFTFTQRGVDPMWAIREVGLLPTVEPKKAGLRVPSLPKKLIPWGRKP
jgi:hexosaminidase